MKGYFSRLIQQMGITFGDTNDYRPDALEQTLIRSEESDTTLSIHVEEERQIAPQQDQEIKNVNITDHTGEDPESSVQISKNENIQHPSENTQHSNKNTQHSIEERFENKPSHLSQKPEPAERKHMVFGRDIQPSSETVKPQREINRKKLLESEETIKINNANKEHAQQSVKPLTSPGQEYRKDTASEPRAKSTDQTFQAKTKQVYLKEVREWVAGTSRFNNEKIKNGDAIETKNMEKMILQSESEIPAASYPEPIEQQERGEPEIHDFHLSIGTISLTIEEPQKGPQSKELPRIVNAKSREQKETSRLSRHYIRI